MSDAAPDPARGRASGPGRHRAARVPPEEPGADEPEPGDGPAEPTFPPKPFLRTGYDKAAVDAFTTMVVLAIHEERQTSVSAEDVAHVRFPGRRFGHGYRMRDVDDYLGAAEALLRMRAADRGNGPAPGNGLGKAPDDGEQHGTEHSHHPTWWIYGVAVVLAIVVVVFTLTQT